MLLNLPTDCPLHRIMVLTELPMMSAHHYALTIFLDQVKVKTTFWIQFFVCHQLNYPFNSHSLAAFLLVETFIKMNSGVPAYLHGNWRGFDIKSERYFKRGTFFPAS